MKHCRKCAIQIDGDARICRRCGAILEEPPTDGDEAALAGAGESGGAPFFAPRGPIAGDARPNPVDEFVQAPADWICQECGEAIEPQFDACWHCGTQRDGTRLPDFTDESGGEDPPAAAENWAANQATAAGPIAPPRGCLRCGSTEIIAGVKVVTYAAGDPTCGRIELMAVEDHERLLFMGRQARLTADVCGQCGHVELRAENVPGLRGPHRAGG